MVHTKERQTLARPHAWNALSQCIEPEKKEISHQLLPFHLHFPFRQKVLADVAFQGVNAFKL